MLIPQTCGRDAGNDDNRMRQLHGVCLPFCQKAAMEVENSFDPRSGGCGAKRGAPEKRGETSPYALFVVSLHAGIMLGDDEGPQGLRQEPV